MDYKTLFSADGSRADLTEEEWLGGWMTIVGGVNGRPTAQQFNAVFYIIQQMIFNMSKTVEETKKTATDAVPTTSFTKVGISNLIADGTLIANLNAEMLGGKKMDYFAPATAAFALYKDSYANNVHNLTGNGYEHGYVYLDTAYSSGQSFRVNGVSVKPYAGGDALDEMQAGHWYVFTYDKGKAQIDFVGLGMAKYMPKSGGQFTGTVYFGGSTYYVTTAGAAKFASLSCSGEIKGGKVYGALFNDYAEFFLRGETTEPGDIIGLDPNSERECYIRAMAGMRTVGVHSEEYSHLIGGDEPPDDYDGGYADYNMAKYIPVGMVGRCHCKVRGPVKRGDYITPSKEPGVGVVSSHPDPLDVVGYAVEDSPGEDVHLVRIKLRG